MFCQVEHIVCRERDQIVCLLSPVESLLWRGCLHNKVQTSQPQIKIMSGMWPWQRVGLSTVIRHFSFYSSSFFKKSFSLNISWLSSICCTCGVPKVSICLLFSGYTASFEQRIISHYSQMSAIDSLSHSVSSGTLASQKELPVSAANQCQITLIWP